MQTRNESEIFVAIVEKNLPGIERIIKAGANLAEVNAKQQTPIQYAASLQHWDVVSAIAKAKPSDEKDTYKYGEVLLTALEAKRPVDEIIALVKAGANMTIQDAKNRTAMQLAYLLGWKHVEAIAAVKKTDKNDSAHYGAALISTLCLNIPKTAQSLLNAGAHPTWTVDKNSCLHFAIKNKDMTTLELLLEHNAKLSDVNEQNQTPIQYAAFLGQWDYVEAIAKKKQSDEKDTYKYGEVLLSAIKAVRPVAEIELLVTAGADLTVTVQDAEKQTAMQLAKNKWGYVEAIAKNKKTNAEDTYKYSDVLFSAMKANRPVAEITILVEAGADLTAQDADKHTPIQYAALHDGWDYVKATIAKVKKSNDQDLDHAGDALRLAVIRDQFETVKVLLEAKVTTTWITLDTENCSLHEAVINKNPKMVALLLQHQANAGAKNKDGQTPLELACTLGAWKCAAEFTMDKKFKFKDQAKAGLAFIDAIKAGQLEIAAYLFSAGASITEQTQPDGHTALHWAVVENNIKAIQNLLRLNASQTALNQADKTPVELACELGYWDCAQALIEADNNNEVDKKKITDLHYENTLLNTIKLGNYAIAKLLLEHHAPCDRWNSDMGNIALYWAVKNHKNIPDLVTLLLDHGADPDQKNKDGKTTLDQAKDLGHTECQERLLRYKSGQAYSSDTAQVKKAEEIFESLIDNSQRPENIAVTIFNLEQALRIVLVSDLETFKTRRRSIELSHEESAQYELNKLNALIATISSLLNFPQKPLVVPFHDSVEAKNILMYVWHKYDIQVNTEKVRIALADLQAEITQTKWQVKALKGFKEGIPNHVGRLKNSLNALSYAQSAQDIFKIYADVLYIFNSIPNDEESKKKRHPTTSQFYLKKCDEIRSISFTTSDPAYASFMLHNLQLQQHVILPMSQSIVSPTPGLYPIIEPSLAFNSELTVQPDLSLPQDEPLYPKVSLSNPVQSSVTPVTKHSLYPEIYSDSNPVAVTSSVSSAAQIESVSTPVETQVQHVIQPQPLTVVPVSQPASTVPTATQPADDMTEVERQMAEDKARLEKLEQANDKVRLEKLEKALRTKALRTSDSGLFSKSASMLRNSGEENVVKKKVPAFP